MPTLAMKPVSLSAAECAARIRKELKTAFPGVKFRVRSARFSQGSSVDVYYTDGPPIAAVEAIVDAYGGRAYDSQHETTSYAEGSLRLTKDGPIAYTCGAWLDVNREYSDAGKARVCEILNATDWDDAHKWGNDPAKLDLREKA